jgi:N-acetylglucosaminyl-diphospho-decaprenol L-rhamnosyltransferase
MPTFHDLTLVTISYNSAAIIGQHIASLDLGAISENERPHWIIVDNDSRDGTPGLISEKYQWVKVIANPKNIGFGAAANQGIKAATTRFVMILNPDTVLSSEALSTMRQALIDDEKAAMAGPNVTDNPMTGVESVEWIVGAAMMMDTTKMNSIGYFDEGFFLYYEETDLCIRTIQEGYKILHCHNAHIPHAEGESSTRTESTHYFLFWHMGKSYARICQKHPKKFAPLPTYLKKQRRRLLISYLTRNKKRHLSTKAKIDGATAATTQPVNTITFSSEKPS